jgi:hypothetical protein
MAHSCSPRLRSLSNPLAPLTSTLSTRLHAPSVLYLHPASQQRTQSSPDREKSTRMASMVYESGLRPANTSGKAMSVSWHCKNSRMLLLS